MNDNKKIIFLGVWNRIKTHKIEIYTYIYNDRIIGAHVST